MNNIYYANKKSIVIKVSDFTNPIGKEGITDVGLKITPHGTISLSTIDEMLSEVDLEFVKHFLETNHIEFDQDVLDKFVPSGAKFSKDFGDELSQTEEELSNVLKLHESAHAEFVKEKAAYEQEIRSLTGKVETLTDLSDKMEKSHKEALDKAVKEATQTLNDKFSKKIAVLSKAMEDEKIQREAKYGEALFEKDQAIEEQKLKIIALQDKLDTQEKSIEKRESENLEAFDVLDTKLKNLLEQRKTLQDDNDKLKAQSLKSKNHTANLEKRIALYKEEVEDGKHKLKVAQEADDHLNKKVEELKEELAKMAEDNISLLAQIDSFEAIAPDEDNPFVEALEALDTNFVAPKEFVAFQDEVKMVELMQDVSLPTSDQVPIDIPSPEVFKFNSPDCKFEIYTGMDKSNCTEISEDVDGVKTILVGQAGLKIIAAITK